MLQDRTFEVLGSSTRRDVDVRVVVGHQPQPGRVVARGEFREDLLYRLNLIVLHLPPLRERRGDIPRAGRPLPPDASPRCYRRDDLSFSAAALHWLQSSPGRATSASCARRSSAPCWSAAAATCSTSTTSQRPPTCERDAPGRAATTLPPVGSMTLDEIEQAMIVKSLAHHGGNISRVAESLGLSRAALYRRLEKYGIRL